jgi:hypothetical protein
VCVFVSTFRMWLKKHNWPLYYDCISVYNVNYLTKDDKFFFKKEYPAFASIDAYGLFIALNKNYSEY